MTATANTEVVELRQRLAEAESYHQTYRLSAERSVSMLNAEVADVRKRLEATLGPLGEPPPDPMDAETATRLFGGDDRESSAVIPQSVSRIFDRVASGEITPEEGSRQLAEIEGRRPWWREMLCRLFEVGP